jgi:hypothetical protein
MVEGVKSSIIYLIYGKNFCKCHNVLPSNTMINNNKASKKRKSKVALPLSPPCSTSSFPPSFFSTFLFLL